MGFPLSLALRYMRSKKQASVSVGTLFAVFSRVDRSALHQALFSWNGQVLAALPGGAAPWQATSVDGKALKGSAKQQALDPHLLSAVRHGLGLTRSQEAVSAKENEIPAMKRLLEGLVVKGEVFTMDALLTQKDIARQIVGAGGTT